MKQKLLKIIIPFTGILLLILDSKTAIVGASEGIELCIKVIIPSLFPFFMLSVLLTGALSGVNLQPKSAIFVIGLLGGYPMGAKSIADACQRGLISRNNGEKWLAFCNNAGPAFLFGIGIVLFDHVGICFLAWTIHILSAFLVGVLTPSEPEICSTAEETPISVTAALQKAIESMALVCGWVILFKVVMAIISRWFLWMVPEEIQSVIFGVLELSNGCCMLEAVQPIGLRFILFSAFLGFGGLCVTLQTMSVISASQIRRTYYLPGKLTQTAVSVLLSCCVQSIVFQEEAYALPSIIIFLSVATIILYAVFTKKIKLPVAFSNALMYNTSRKQRINLMNKR